MLLLWALWLYEWKQLIFLSNLKTVFSYIRTSPVRATYLKWLIGDSLIQRYLHWLSSSICAVLTSCTKYHASCDAKPLEKTYLLTRYAYIFGENTFVFIICFKQIFLTPTKFDGHKKDLGSNWTRMSPVSGGLDRTVSRKSSIWGVHICAGRLDTLIIYIYFTTWTVFADCAN